VRRVGRKMSRDDGESSSSTIHFSNRSSNSMDLLIQRALTQVREIVTISPSDNLDSLQAVADISCAHVVYRARFRARSREKGVQVRLGMSVLSVVICVCVRNVSLIHLSVYSMEVIENEPTYPHIVISYNIYTVYYYTVHSIHIYSTHIYTHRQLSIRLHMSIYERPIWWMKRFAAGFFPAGLDMENTYIWKEYK
jgi:hypothetical protein